MNKILIKNARMVNEGAVTEGDLLIAAGHIERIGGEITASAGMDVVDARGLLLVPGMIDDQVHFREPGLTHKADMATESRAAVAGGITSFMDMPNTNPQTLTLDALEEKFLLAEGRSLANYAFYLGAANDNLDQVRALAPNQTCGIKVFMGASTGNMLVDDPRILDALFRDAPTLIAAHCEDTPLIKANEERYRQEYGDDIPMRLHPLIRNEEACYRSSSLAVELARRHGTRLHVLHITSARELGLFEPGTGDKRITAEACVHHLYFDDRDYEEKGNLIKCNPAIKSVADRAALRTALVDGRIDLIGTDHAPHTLQEKAAGYFKAPAGLPLVQHALPLALELYHDGDASLELIVEKTAHAPARLFHVAERGFLREGYWADLVLLQLGVDQEVRREDVLYKCGWSPLEGRHLRSRVAATFVNGVKVYDDGKVSNAAPGQRLKFQRD
ncbi:MAG: dihydroorotase [Gammaproteobacteria bacterium RIFOXYA12_FULL_61_12]|nr:MAG: dihydroorotase [Gammaproteobacteria bacterium RIFOXYD12_FULL_61_37]OGT94306.1 MAG: dihydroorotase [Gammaproteobacteria bacterium RIFOXYA12_FULL_61_12]